MFIYFTIPSTDYIIFLYVTCLQKYQGHQRLMAILFLKYLIFFNSKLYIKYEFTNQIIYYILVK